MLYVEDEDEIRENTRRPLMHFCHDILVASDAVEGLRLYQEHRPDIVILDIEIPNMGGIEMCNSIKEIEPTQHIVFSTAHSESGYFMEAIDMQVDGYIHKPIDYNLLENKLNDIIKQINVEYSLRVYKILTREIVKLQNNLLVVLNDTQDVIYSNDNFLDFLQIENLSQYKKRYSSLGDLFLENEEFFVPDGMNDRTWIDRVEILEDNKRIVSMLNLQLGRPQVFLISIQKIEEVAYSIIIFTEITNLTTEKKVYKQKAFTDALTNIYNRAYFNEELSRQIIIYEQKQRSFSFLLFDIDEFKKFDDTYGHQTGDKILVELAAIICRHTGPEDMFARWGGEEFVKILPSTFISEAVDIAE